MSNPIPPHPNFIPDEIRATATNQWLTRLPPEGFALFIEAVKQYLIAFNGIVEVQERGTGWTITVDLPQPPNRDDLILE